MRKLLKLQNTKILVIWRIARSIMKQAFSEESIDINELGFPKELAERVTRHIIESTEDTRVIVQPTRKNRNGDILQLTVGCRNESHRLAGVPFIGFSLNQFVKTVDLRISSFYLALTGVMGNVDGNGSIESVTVIPGTDLSEFSEIFANVYGERCVFPHVRTAIEVLCGYMQDGEDPVYGRFSHQSKSLTVIGHSLGGSAAQFVALSVPRSVLFG